MEQSSQPTDFLHSSLYGNNVWATIILRMAVFISILSAAIKTDTYILVLSLSCIAPSLANQVLTNWINMQLRTVLTKIPRKRSQLFTDINGLPPDSYIFGNRGETRSGFIINMIWRTVYLNIISLILLFLSVFFLILHLMKTSLIAPIILGSFLPIIYVVEYTLLDWHNNGEKHVNWHFLQD